MNIIENSLAQQLKDEFASLNKKVKLIFLTEILRCQYCKEVEMLYKDLIELTDKIELKVQNLYDSKDLVQKYNLMELTPLTIIQGENDEDYGIRLYGITAGYEFSTLIEAIKLVSTGKHQLSEESINFLKTLKNPLDIKVFVTVSCPYCPMAVNLAFNFAYVSEKVNASMIEVSEFPHLANKYQVFGVPKTVINDSIHIEGAVPEEVLLDYIKKL